MKQANRKGEKSIDRGKDREMMESGQDGVPVIRSDRSRGGSKNSALGPSVDGLSNGATHAKNGGGSAERDALGSATNQHQISAAPNSNPIGKKKTLSYQIGLKDSNEPIARPLGPVVTEIQHAVAAEVQDRMERLEGTRSLKSKVSERRRAAEEDAGEERAEEACGAEIFGRDGQRADDKTDSEEEEDTGSDMELDMSEGRTSHVEDERVKQREQRGSGLENGGRGDTLMSGTGTAKSLERKRIPFRGPGGKEMAFSTHGRATPREKMKRMGREEFLAERTVEFAPENSDERNKRDGEKTLVVNLMGRPQHQVRELIRELFPRHRYVFRTDGNNTI
eukprot:TRINITY_DN885_c3_g1_i5.p2 TRINITY_DN885_c3_g1~~TRINITY_DN885_c3_g1_i5.p2  ORF type:complete len:336 (+),score=25.90 TRINITY_DN885_c3_g1_i5:172-1179(+)